MPATVQSGARAKLGFYDRSTGQPRYVGIFSDVSYGVTYDTQAAFVLGRYSAAALDYTAQEIMDVSCSGWNVINHGPYVDGGFPALIDLLTHDYMTMSIIDRASGLETARIDYVRPVNYSKSFNARQLSTMSLRYVGILVNDESKPDNQETSTATPMLPSGY